MPFILYGGLALGHWLFTGHGLDLTLQQFTRHRAFEYVGEWWIGSLVLGLLVAAAGTVITYGCARLTRAHET